MTLTVVAAVNDEAVYGTTLARSPDLVSGMVPVVPVRHAESASIAYNRGLARADTDLVVFAHQDVYLPSGWTDLICRRVSELPATWATLGVYGVEAGGRHVGCVWSQGLGRQVGAPFEDARPVVSLDELLLVVRCRSRLTFDETLPGFHLYGTDLVQTALASGSTAFAVCAPVVHNSLPVRRLDSHYVAAYRHLQRKWRSRLPLPTAVAPITVGPWSLALARWRRRSADASVTRVADCRSLALSLGYEEDAA